MFKRANIRELSEMDSFLAAATWLAIGFQRITADGTHHVATSVSRPIRTTLFWAPMSFTSLKSIMYRSLSIAGGGTELGFSLSMVLPVPNQAAKPAQMQEAWEPRRPRFQSPLRYRGTGQWQNRPLSARRGPVPLP